LNKFSIILLLLFCNSIFGQSFITKVSSKAIGKKDVLQIEYLAEDASVEQFILPNLNNWNLISGPNFSSSTVQTGKLVKQQTSYSIMVQPKATGKLIIPGATALINNKPQRSNTVLVEVKNADHVGGNQPAPQNSLKGSTFDQLHLGEEQPADQFLKKGENARDKIKGNILIKLDVNKRSCFVGEPILASYKLCTRVRSQSRVVKQPMFNGCTVIEMTGTEEPVARREMINGKSYNVYVIRKVQLFPLQEGSLVLPQLSVENKVAFYDASRLNYRDLYYNSPALPVEEQLVTLQNAPVTVDVKPLPPMPSVGSSIFSGAVGKFDAEVSTDNKLLETNNTNELLFTIIGEGNLQQVKAPVINWPAGIEAFDPAEQGQDDKTHFPLMVRKAFSFPFVVNKKGIYTIPPVSFTYFDPSANKYITKVTAPLTLHVAKGSKINLRSIIKTSDAEDFENRLYIILGVAFVAMTIGVVWYNQKHKAKPVSAPAVAKAKEAKANAVNAAKEEPKEAIDTSRYIYEIKDLQPDSNSSAFYKDLYKNLNLYIQAKYNIAPANVSEYIQERLKYDFNFHQLNSLLQNCSLGMYTPVFTIEEAMEHRLLAIEVLNKLEKGQAN
jgi:preprotein translocase subunit SecG